MPDITLRLPLGKGIITSDGKECPNYFAMTEYLLGNTPKPKYKPEGKFSWKEFRAMLKADKKNEHFTGKWREILCREIKTANGIDKGLQK